MKALNKSEYREFVESGFRPHYKVVKTVHGNFHYLVDSDYNNYIKFLENKRKKEKKG